MRPKTIISLVSIVLTFVVTSLGAQFRASDLIYVSAVAHTRGANDSVWTSDVTITNVEPEDSIDVAVVFVPTGLTNNASLFNDRSNWLGGRAEDDFGIIESQLADIPAGGFVVLKDIIGEYWLENEEDTDQGALVVFAYLAGSLMSDGSSEFRNCTVSSRTFSTGIGWEPDPDNEGEFLESEVTFGQGIDGVPWYNLADGGFKDDEAGIDYSYLLLDGGQQNSDFRYNLGVFNTSDRQTTLTLLIQPFKTNGQPLVDSADTELNYVAVLPPLANVFYYSILDTLWHEGDIDAVRFKVSMLGWSTSGVDPKPTFTTFGSLVGNTSNDPTTYTPTFATPYNIECMWPSADDGGGDGKRAVTLSRPLRVPPA